ncbi:glutathione S-transferase kappa 1-like [Ylistrum balloti]|uniref:glutathione S-transferase kappa 1-like n=1 Tax=Ylistrum balloti TaxID=509963 RepID=UPI002905949A|nr:glutathione S-transferase kappa 1-like [Ylistrum balloti]
MAASTRKTVELFYDVVSPYSWIAFEVMCRYRTKWNIDLKLKPFFLGGIMSGADNKPPGLVPAKAKYMLKHDLSRLGNYYSIPIIPPSNPAEVMFVKGTLMPQRFLTAVDMQQPELVEDLSRQFWMRAWNKDQGISDEEGIRETCKDISFPKDLMEDCLKKTKDQTVKDRLKQFTTEALDLGAFGSPTIVAHVNNKREMVFGSDRFLILASILNEEWLGPLKELSKAKL